MLQLKESVANCRAWALGAPRVKAARPFAWLAS
jgi:hypothetical protein